CASSRSSSRRLSSDRMAMRLEMSGIGGLLSGRVVLLAKQGRHFLFREFFDHPQHLLSPRVFFLLCLPQSLDVRLNGRGKLDNGWCLEQTLRRELHLESVSHPRNQLNGQQRMASQLEKFVVDANGCHTKNLLPDLGDRLFHLGSGSHKLCA